MKKGDILVGNLVGFKYITSKETGDKYCLATVADAQGKQYKVLLGSQSDYPFSTMLQLKGSQQGITAQCSAAATKNTDARFTNVEFSL